MGKGIHSLSRVLLLLLPWMALSILWSGHAGSKEATQKWTFETGSEAVSTPAIGHDGTIYVGSGNHRVYAIDTEGRQKWAFETGGSVLSPPAVGPDGTIYAGSADGRLYAISRNGTFKWAYQTSDALYSSPMIARDGTIYVTSWDHHVYALSTDGLLRWTFDTGDGLFSSPAMGPEGTIYVGARDGRLYALKAEERPRSRRSDDGQVALEEGFKEIREIRFEAEDHGEERLVCLLNGIFSPKVSTLDGERPRVICDFGRARLADNISQDITVIGAQVQHIGTSLYGPFNEKVKVVLEFQPAAAGRLEGQCFDEEFVYGGKKGYLYMLIFKPQQTRTNNSPQRHGRR